MEPTCSAPYFVVSSPSTAAGSAPAEEKLFSANSAVQGARGDTSSIARSTTFLAEKDVSKGGATATAKLPRRAATRRSQLEGKHCAPGAGESNMSLQRNARSALVRSSFAESFSGAKVKHHKSASSTVSFSSSRQTAPDGLFTLCKGDVFKYLWISYRRTQPPLIILIDSFIVSLLLMALLLSLYVLVVGTSFPRNAFVAALLSCGGTAVLTICLRTQVSEKNTFHLSEERALADYLLCNLVLHYAALSYVG